MKQHSLPKGLLPIAFVAITLFQSACTKPTLIGSDIFPPEDAVSLNFTDTVTLQTTTIPTDSVITYSSATAQQLDNYLIGRLADPIFGNSFAAAYAQLRLLTTSPKFENTQLDSVILSLVYSTDGGHTGDVSALQELKVYEVTEFLDPTEAYFSNVTFSRGQVLGAKTFVANTKDSITIKIPEGDTVFARLVPPQIRIPLSTSLGNRLLNNSSEMKSNDDFTEFFKGIYIEPSRQTNGMFRYNLEGSKVTLYYTQIDSTFDSSNNFEGFDTVARAFDFVINTFSTKVSAFRHDRQGLGQARIEAPVNAYLNGTSDSLFFVQSMQGLNGKIAFPFIEDLKGKVIVNKAELVVTVANKDNLLQFLLPEQFILLEKINDELYLIEDVVVSFDRAGGFDLFGGDMVTGTINGQPVSQYKLNITAHLQDMIEGNTEENAIYLTTYLKSQVSNRVVLGGATHSKYPIKLNLTYTKID